MSKAVKWQLPFVTNDVTNPIRYRIDISAEGYTGTPIQLKGGATPFVTEENDSEDFFTPVRSQTGNIEICTALPSGGMLSLDDILPSNNIERPVRLVSINGNTETVEWQGFLSCEAYSQLYTDTPEILTIPVISVLGALASVQVTQEHSSGLATIANATYNALNEINLQTGMSLFTHVRYSMTAWRIFQKYIDQTVFFDRNEYNNENSTTYIVSGLSALDAIRQICAFMGFVVREQKTEVFFEYIGETIGMYQQTLYNFGNNFHQSITPSAVITSQDIANLTWRGADHMRSIMQGAKSVEVVANVKKYELNIALPEFPVGNTTVVYRQLWRYNEQGDWLYLVANQNTTAYSNIQMAFYAADSRYSFSHFENYGTTTLNQVLSHMSVAYNSTAKNTIFGSAMTLYRWYAGAFLARYCWETSGDLTAHDTKDALYCAFFPHALNYLSDYGSDFDPSQVGAIFSINNITNYRCNTGYLKISGRTDTIFMWPSSDYTGAELIHSDSKETIWLIALELQFGSQWWNGSSWQPTQCTFNVQMYKGGFRDNWVNTMTIPQTDGHLIPITSDMQGLITLKIWPMASRANYSTSTGIIEMAFSSLDVDHVVPEDATLTSRGQNHYYKLLGVNFSDEKSIAVDWASFLNNNPSPSLVLDDPATPMRTMDYLKSSGLVSLRPEVDLLNRMSAYYGSARQNLKLKVKHPSTTLALLKLNGIGDGKKYLPLAEIRDWKEEVCTLTCFETNE